MIGSHPPAPPSSSLPFYPPNSTHSLSPLTKQENKQELKTNKEKAKETHTKQSP